MKRPSRLSSQELWKNPRPMFRGIKYAAILAPVYYLLIRVIRDEELPSGIGHGLGACGAMDETGIMVSR